MMHQPIVSAALGVEETPNEALLPQNVEAEVAVLGALLIDPDAIAQIAHVLHPDDFYHEAHRTIYQAALDLVAAGSPADLLTITDALACRGVLEDVGGSSYVSSLANHVPTSRNISHYAQIVIRSATNRRLIKAAAQIASVACSNADAAVALEQAETMIAGVRAHVERGTSGKTNSYPLLTDIEVEAFTPARGILGDLLFEDSVAYLFGDSDTWKTFVAVSWCLCLATGTPWLGREVQQGPAIYIPAEGARGLGKRITAWKHHHGIAGQSVDFYTVPMPVNLLDRHAVPILIENIQAHQRLAGRPPRIIVFDTLASSMDGGDENDTPDANRVTAAVRALKHTFGCCVLLLHHSGNAFIHRMRGNSAFRNNADTVIRVVAPALPDGQKRKPGDLVMLHSDKAKDDTGFDDIHLTAALEEWTTEDGAPVSSLVIVPTDRKPAVRGEVVIMPQSSRTALQMLAQIGKPATASEWEHSSTLVHRTFYDARDDLVARQYVASDAPPRTKGAHYSITEAGRNLLSATVHQQCEQSTPAQLHLTEDDAESGSALMDTPRATSPRFMGTVESAAESSGIYSLAPSHQSPNGTAAQAIPFAHRVDQLKAQGLSGEAAVRQALGERGALPDDDGGAA